MSVPYLHKALAEQLQVFNGVQQGLMEASQEFTQRIAQADMEWAAHSPAAQANEMNTPPSMLGANQFDRPNLSGPFVGL